MSDKKDANVEPIPLPENRLLEWPPKAVAEVQADAVKGNVEANITLKAFAYSLGHGVPQDYKKAVELYKIAATKGYAPAQNCLGWAYSRGYGVAVNGVKAVQWYEAAAQQNYVVAQFNLVTLDSGLMS